MDYIINIDNQISVLPFTGFAASSNTSLSLVFSNLSGSSITV